MNEQASEQSRASARKIKEQKAREQASKCETDRERVSVRVRNKRESERECE